MDESLEPGQVIAGKLKVVRKIGGGGMGAVYEVEHLLTKHRRALKVVSSTRAGSTHVERLLREATVASRLDTPHVIDTLDAGELDDGSPYVLMELLDGVSLIDIVQLHAPLDVPHMLDIAIQICDGMAVAHEAGIIHRDLKPENVFLVRDRTGKEIVKIIDFGISHFRDLEKGEAPSRLTAEGMVIGTPFYMSPEQAGGAPVDERTDVYALGVMLYEGLTGKLPFDAETTGALFVKIGTGEYLPLKHRRRDLDPALAAVVERAFHRKPKERYRSMRELKEALVPFLESARKSADAALRRATLTYGSSPAEQAQGTGAPSLVSDEHARLPDSEPPRAPRPAWRRSRPDAATEDVEVDRSFALGDQAPKSAPKSAPEEDEASALEPVEPKRAPSPASRATAGRIAVVIASFGIALGITLFVLWPSREAVRSNEESGDRAGDDQGAVENIEVDETGAENTEPQPTLESAEGNLAMQVEPSESGEESAEDETDEGADLPSNRGMMRRALTPAERANLETNPYMR